MANINKSCDFKEITPGIWVCNVCKFEAKTNGKPVRECGRLTVKPPTMSQMAISAGKAVVNLATGGFASVEVVAKRLNTCISCELFNNGSCRKCGCPVLRKAQIQNETCPHPLNNKWGNETTSNKTKRIRPAPIAGIENGWTGEIAKKAHEYDITVVIPILCVDEALGIVIELIRLQDISAYIILVYTGNTEKSHEAEALRANDLEVHYIHPNSTRHPSEIVSMALDVGTSVVQTQFVFFTHADCFLQSNQTLSQFRNEAREYFIYGHQISERPYEDWQNEYGHTALCVDQDKLYDAGIRWKMRMTMSECDKWLNPDRPNDPDTETTFNALLKTFEKEPNFSGSEENFKRNTDSFIDHVRSFCGSKIYSEEYHKTASEWMKEAIADARKRISEWKT